MATKKQTAVEFLLNNVHLKNTHYWPHLVDQAKRIESEQVEAAYRTALQRHLPIQYTNELDEDLFSQLAKTYYLENHG